MSLSERDSRLIESHPSYLAAHSIVNCVGGCMYCFLPNGKIETSYQGAKRNSPPHEIAPPKDTVDAILHSQYYTPTIPM